MQMLSQNVYSRVASIRGRLIATHLNQLYYDKVSPQEALREVTQIQPLWHDIDKVFHTFFILTEPQLEFLAKKNGAGKDMIAKIRDTDTDFFTVDKDGQTHPVDFVVTMSVFGMLDYYIGLKEQRDARKNYARAKKARYAKQHQEQNKAKGYGEQVFDIKRTPTDNTSEATTTNQNQDSQHKANSTTPPQAPSTHVFRHVFNKARIAISDFFNK